MQGTTEVRPRPMARLKAALTRLHTARQREQLQLPCSPPLFQLVPVRPPPKPQEIAAWLLDEEQQQQSQREAQVREARAASGSGFVMDANTGKLVPLVGGADSQVGWLTMKVVMEMGICKVPGLALCRIVLGKCSDSAIGAGCFCTNQAEPQSPLSCCRAVRKLETVCWEHLRWQARGCPPGSERQQRGGCRSRPPQPRKRMRCFAEPYGVNPAQVQGCWGPAAQGLTVPHDCTEGSCSAGQPLSQRPGSGPGCSCWAVLSCVQPLPSRILYDWGAQDSNSFPLARFKYTADALDPLLQEPI